MLSSCLQVRSPLSDAILGEQMLVVSEDKVAVTELRAAVGLLCCCSHWCAASHPFLFPPAGRDGCARLLFPQPSGRSSEH